MSTSTSTPDETVTREPRPPASSRTRGPRVAIVPDFYPEYESAVREAGAVPVGEDRDPEVLVWSRHGSPSELERCVDRLDRLRWVQLPSAGVEQFFGTGVIERRPEIVWTSAKSAYAQPVAEHALTLLLALLREIPSRVRATSWGPQRGRTLRGLRVLVIGGGGIAHALAALLEPFETETIAIRRKPVEVRGADRTLGMQHLYAELERADAVVLACALTPQTLGMISAAELGVMKSTAILVNVARGGLVITEDLVDALRDDVIAGAALDVTDPEPLPDGHALWELPNSLVTPHTADTVEMIVPMLASRIRENVCRFREGRELLGVLDLAEGY